MPATESFRGSRMREIRPSGLMRGEAAHAPPLLDRFLVFSFLPRIPVRQAKPD
jgi:hypothetical protein